MVQVGCFGQAEETQPEKERRAREKWEWGKCQRQGQVGSELGREDKRQGRE